MNRAIRSALRKRDRLLKAFRRTKSAARWENYRRQRNLVVALIRSAKRAHEKKINDLLSDASTSSKMWWRITKSLYGGKVCSSIPPLNDNNNLIANSKKKAYAFNEYFVAQTQFLWQQQTEHESRGDAQSNHFLWERYVDDIFSLWDPTEKTSQSSSL